VIDLARPRFGRKTACTLTRADEPGTIRPTLRIRTFPLRVAFAAVTELAAERIRTGVGPPSSPPPARTASTLPALNAHRPAHTTVAIRLSRVTRQILRQRRSEAGVRSRRAATAAEQLAAAPADHRRSAGRRPEAA
jgi:uroporphyrinogen-III synthase